MLLGGKVYWYPWEGYGNNCNTYLIAGEKNVLVDPGHLRNEFRESCMDTLEQKLKKDGFSFEDIKLIICTHGHPDHFESASFLRDKSGARVAIHKDEEPMLQAISGIYRERQGDNAPDMTPDILLDEGELEAGDTVIKVIHTPGHSPGSVSFYLPEEKALISGDTVFRGSIGRTDLPGGNMDTMKESVDKLSLLDDIEWLLPGHMDLVEGNENVKRNFETIKNYFFR